MEPNELPDPPGDGHPLPPPPDHQWNPEPGDAARLLLPALGDTPVTIPDGTAVTITGPPDDYGDIPVAAVLRVTATVPAHYLQEETT